MNLASYHEDDWENGDIVHAVLMSALGGGEVSFPSVPTGEETKYTLKLVWML
jgi:hypothetical protein